MGIMIHQHAKDRMVERGASEEEVVLTIKTGEEFQAKFNRIGYRHNFSFNNLWKGKKYNIKQLEVYAVRENSDLIVITVLTKFF